MYSISLNLSSEEWVHIKQHAEKQWPYESLSVGEILRRYILIGIQTLKNISPDEQARLAYRFQASMPIGDSKLKS